MLSLDIEKELRDFNLKISLSVSEGETVVLIGENGAGKSTLLNMISGLMDPDSGVITLNQKKLFSAGEGINIPADERNIGHLFQSYALFPHYSVYDNIAFGLRCRKIKKADIESRVNAQIETMHLSDLRDINVGRLSGGQRQRVALARALVLDPDLLLLDEPLAAVDVLMQTEMRRELRHRMKEANIPSIIVTHTFADALELGDRIAIIQKGKIVQEGAPEEVFNNPATDFVAKFTGMENLFRGKSVLKAGGEAEIHVGSLVIHTVTSIKGDVYVAIRAEELIFSKEALDSTARNVFSGHVSEIKWNGVLSRITVNLGDIQLSGLITRQSLSRLNIIQGDTIYVSFKASAVHVFPYMN
jgi:molybdate transport system ATP-binding protein